MKIIPDNSSLLDLTLTGSLIIGALSGSYWTLVQAHYKLKNESNKKPILRKELMSLLISYILSAICISSLVTLVVQYLYPPVAVWGSKAYYPFFRGIPPYVQWLSVLIIFTILVFSLNSLVKTINKEQKETSDSR